MEKKTLGLNLYDLNKTIINQFKPLTEEQLTKNAALIEEFKNKYSDDKHFMLLCRDFNYYTLFEQQKEKKKKLSFSGAVLEILEELGKVLSIELTEDKSAIEIWIELSLNDSKAFYLFPYEKGVVYYG